MNLKYIIILFSALMLASCSIGVDIVEEETPTEETAGQTDGTDATNNNN